LILNHVKTLNEEKLEKQKLKRAQNVLADKAPEGRSKTVIPKRNIDLSEPETYELPEEEKIKPPN
jgi:hypothetical protein